VVTHPLLDLFTTYGTLLLWPWPHRFALDAVAILDPFYSLQLALALVLGWRWRRQPQRGAVAALAALVLSTAFLFYGLALNEQAVGEARRQLASVPRPGQRVHAYPTLLQPWLRRLVARDGRQVRVGLLSLWQTHEIAWRGFEEADDARLAAALDTPDGRLFAWFSQGQLTGRVLAPAAAPPAPAGASVCVEFDDLRYGFGDDPRLGLWGVRLWLDAQGRQVGAAERFNRRPASVRATATRLWQATFRPGG
jgi:inner membrane protein